MSRSIDAALTLATVEKTCMVFNLRGHGLLDLAAFDKQLDGELLDWEHPAHEIDLALQDLPVV